MRDSQAVLSSAFSLPPPLRPFTFLVGPITPLLSPRLTCKWLSPQRIRKKRKQKQQQQQQLAQTERVRPVRPGFSHHNALGSISACVNIADGVNTSLVPTMFGYQSHSYDQSLPPNSLMHATRTHTAHTYMNRSWRAEK